jgi:hypothetical protein
MTETKAIEDWIEVEERGGDGAAIQQREVNYQTIRQRQTCFCWNRATAAGAKLPDSLEKQVYLQSSTYTSTTTNIVSQPSQRTGNTAG